MVSARWALRLAAASALLVRAPTADAWTCGPLPGFELFPPPFVPAPTNTHLWVSVNASAWSALGGCPRVDSPDEAHRPCVAPDLDYELRSAPIADQERHTVAIDTLRTRLPERDVYELVPRERLHPGLRYDVVAIRPGHEHFAGTVRVGKAADTSAPTWTGPLSGYRPARPPRTKNGRVVITLDEYEYAAPVYVNTTAAVDAGATAPLRYELWRADKNGTIDYTAPPAGFGLTMEPRFFADPARAPLLGFGKLDCQGWSFDSSDEGPLRLGLVAVDLAGNRSAPRVIDVEARK